jgi:hypothetical protein
LKHQKKKTLNVSRLHIYPQVFVIRNHYIIKCEKADVGAFKYRDVIRLKKFARNAKEWEEERSNKTY